MIFRTEKKDSSRLTAQFGFQQHKIDHIDGSDDNNKDNEKIYNDDNNKDNDKINNNEDNNIDNDKIKNNDNKAEIEMTKIAHKDCT